MELNVFYDIAIIFGLAVTVVVLFNYLKIPHLVGYLITGILLSPNTSSILSHAHDVEIFAEIGVVLLLFTIGLEFSFTNLKRISKFILVGGGFQVLLTIVLTAILIILMGRPVDESVFWGFVLALSSSAIVIKMLQDRMEITSSHGSITLAILLFQDVMIVPLMLLTPILAGQVEKNVGIEIGWLILKIIVIGGVAFLLTKYVIPRFFRQVLKTKSQEVFLIATLFFVIIITLSTYHLGLSMALGAFVAGLIISETDYNRMAISCILPFRYVFISFFFISMGMLLDYHIFLDEFLLVIFWFLFILLVKTTAAFGAARLLKVDRKTALIVGFSLAQIGEFSFILAQSGLENKLISETNYQIFLAVSIMTMALTPFILENKAKMTDLFVRKQLANAG